MSAILMLNFDPTLDHSIRLCHLYLDTDIFSL